MNIRLARAIAQGYAPRLSFDDEIEAFQTLVDNDLKGAILLQHKGGWSLGRRIQELMNAGHVVMPPKGET